MGPEVHNLYGPTETTIWSTVSRVRSVENRIPIGRPIANTQVYIVDDQLRQLPAGVPYQQVDLEFITRKGYGKNVLQRDDKALNTLAIGRDALRGDARK